MKISDFLRFNVTVSQPYSDRFQAVLHSIYIGIASCLCQMHGYSTLHLMDISVCTFDFINGDRHQIPVSRRNAILRQLRYLARASSCLYDNAVCASLHLYFIIRCFINIAQKNLRMIIRAHFPLNHTVYPAPFLHGVFRSGGSSVVNIAGTQNKFH